MSRNFSDWEVRDILFNLGLYNKIKIDADFERVNANTTEEVWNNFFEEVEVIELHYSKDINKLLDFMSKKKKIYGYCPYCDKELALDIIPIELEKELFEEPIYTYNNHEVEDEETSDNVIDSINMAYGKKIKLLNRYKYFSIKTVCTLESSHIMNFIFHLYILKDKDKYSIDFIKIGQNPSYTELNKYKGRRYSKILKDIDCYDDYLKGINLFSHDIGIAPYVYLRRVIEKLLLFKFKEHKDNISFSFDEFEKMHMEEKIKTLKVYLPDFLVEHKDIYKILSAGIHILDEDVCKDYFPILKTSIDIILQQEEERRDRNLLENEARKNINQISPEVKKKAEEIKLNLAGEGI